MLILTRKLGESITIGDNIKVTVLGIYGRQVRLGIEAPLKVVVHREEIYVKIQNENRKASGAVKEDLGNVVRLLRNKFKGEMKAAGLMHLIDVSVWKKDWNVHYEADVENKSGVGDNHATRYLSNYVYRVAVSDSRVKFVNETVFVSYKKRVVTGQEL